MKVAIIGSRCIHEINIEDYLPEKCEEIVSGGAAGVDAVAADFAKERGIPLKEFFPDYKRYGRGAPIVRNKEIVDYADKIIAFWDGNSKGTLSVIKYAQKAKKSIDIILCK